MDNSPRIPQGFLADTVAQLVLEAYRRLPAKSKPRSLGGGKTEWVTLSGIVLEYGHDSQKLLCSALGTGVKCLPYSKVPFAKGLVLHDCHAEVLAIRALNVFLLEECRRLLSLCSNDRDQDIYESPFIRFQMPQEISPSSPQPFVVRECVKIHMFTSEAPCGDSSMELIMSAQSDPTPWSQPPPLICIPDILSKSVESVETVSGLLRGRGYFSHLGLVRTKPGRPDSPPTLSKSCSDKLSARQYLSVLLTPTSYIIAPTRNAYIQSFILPESEYSKEGTERAFQANGRMKDLACSKVQDLGIGYRFRPFNVMTTHAKFEHSRRRATELSSAPVPSNISALWVANVDKSETLIQGVLQGRKAFPPPAINRGASRACKMRLWGSCVELAAKLASTSGPTPTLITNGPSLANLKFLLNCRVYEHLKVGKEGGDGDNMVGITAGNKATEARKSAKEKVRAVLKGWKRNGGNNFELLEM